MSARQEINRGVGTEEPEEDTELCPNVIETYFPLDEFHAKNREDVRKYFEELVADRSQRRCRLCPGRVFDRCERLENHVRLYHAARPDGVFCSGRKLECKQFKIAKAIADNDMVTQSGMLRGGYIQRSAQMISEALSEDSLKNVNDINSSVAILMTEKGPKIADASDCSPGNARQCGDAFYDHGFALFVYSRMLLADGNVNDTVMEYIGQSQQHGVLASLAMRRCEWWTTLAEQLFYNDPVDRVF